MQRGLLRVAVLALPYLFAIAGAARYPSYGTLQTTQTDGVLNVVINNTYSTINLFDKYVQSDLANLIEELQAPDTDVRVVMLFPVSLLWNITQLPQATIAMIEGRTRGIGNEFIMSCDMRFASTAPSVLFNQFEVSFGVNPGAGGAMYLAHTMGRARAFEYALSAQDVDARTAASIGWINTAFDTSAALHQYVQTLAARIAVFEPMGIAATKTGINAVSRPPFDVLVRDAQNVISGLLGMPSVQAFFEKFIEATHNQSISPLELNYGRDLGELFKCQ
ncbi:ClpP/crotonase-like domain-containing protein [Mycena pura]|uniref:ClpP/crotonase-like domain-containing protein n=1 Tax=Mycena pura TaxID=153505 RepID=A0AAD6YEN4_9AGAR|nr:ClpP/crotonase-like domain-containing protein [Mycena pura]